MESLEGRTLFAVQFLGDLNLVTPDSNPESLTSDGPSAFFFTHDSGTGQSTVWKTDATAAGTVAVKTVSMGSGNPINLLTTNGAQRAFFTGNSNLWTSDGTDPGTIQLADKDDFYRSPTRLYGGAGRLYFFARPTEDSHALYKSDGTVAGTVPVIQFPAGHVPLDDGNSSVRDGLEPVVTASGTVYFYLGGTSQAGLWRSDGTPGGTFRIRAAAPAPAPGDLSWYTDVNGTVFFRAFTGGTEFNPRVGLFKTNGTEAGTVLVRDNIGINSSDFISFNGALYFRGSLTGEGYELCRSDGTTAGTVIVKDLNASTVSTWPSLLTVASGSIYFSAGGNTVTTPGTQVWRSDGTTNGTVQVTPGVAGGGAPTEFAGGGGKVFFTAGNSVWQTDGTPAGTAKILPPDLNLPRQLRSVAGKVLFTADHPHSGNELWHATGAAGGATLLKDLTPVSDGSGPGGFTGPQRPNLFQRHREPRRFPLLLPD